MQRLLGQQMRAISPIRFSHRPEIRAARFLNNTHPRPRVVSAGHVVPWIMQVRVRERLMHCFARGGESGGLGGGAVGLEVFFAAAGEGGGG